MKRRLIAAARILSRKAVELLAVGRALTVNVVGVRCGATRSLWYPCIRARHKGLHMELHGEYVEAWNDDGEVFRFYNDGSYAAANPAGPYGRSHTEWMEGLLWFYDHRKGRVNVNATPD